MKCPDNVLIPISFKKYLKELIFEHNVPAWFENKKSVRDQSVYVYAW